jgi:Fe2+ or Zn2+ uptake regulation protein
VSSTSEYGGTLRIPDLRVARPRVAVLQAVHEHPHTGLPCLTPSHDSGFLEGFVLDEAEVFYWGLCPDCPTSQM